MIRAKWYMYNSTWEQCKNNYILNSVGHEGIFVKW